MPAATSAPRATAERALIMTGPCHGPLRPFTDNQLVSSAGFRMSSPVRKTVSSRRSFVSSPPEGRNIAGSRRRRGDSAWGSRTVAINLPVGREPAGLSTAAPRAVAAGVARTVRGLFAPARMLMKFTGLADRRSIAFLWAPMRRYQFSGDLAATAVGRCNDGSIPGDYAGQ
jgi:hypothetical protein